MLTVDPHPYQDEAIDRAVERESLLIAYEMGLGKTVIAVAAIEELLGSGDVSTAVIVVNASLKWQWAQQIAKLTDVPTREVEVRDSGSKVNIVVPTEEYCVVVADGGPKVRAAKYAQIKESRPDYVIIGYENVLNDWNYVRRIKPECIVLDEATAIKTFKAQRTRKIKRLTARYRFAMTGTPVENGKPEEVFSLMQWVDDSVLGRWDLFDKTYVERNHWGGVLRYKNLTVLHQRLAEAMVRKTRADPEVAKYLPDMQEKVIDVAMDAKTRKVYRRISDDLLEELTASAAMGHGDFDLFALYHGEGGEDNTARGKIMSRMAALDMLLDHPDLVVLSAQAFEESEQQRQAGVVKKSWPGSQYCWEIWQEGLLDDITKSSKFDVAVETIEDIMASNTENKVILFCFYKDMLDLLHEALPEQSVIYDGDMGASAKAAAVQRFTTDPGCRVFLSSHAGALGTDLWMANYLINYDLAWSSGKQDQINMRHDRANSTFKHIFILNLVTERSTEVRKYRGLGHKRRVGSAIVDNQGASKTGDISNDVQSLTDCLLETR